MKILRRLKDILTATQAPVTIGDVTLTASDIEIGAVEIKNGADDTRAVVKTSDGGAGEAGILVRAIPSATAQPVSIAGTVPISDGGGSITVDGAVSVSNFPATQAVSAVQLPAALVGGRLDINIGAASGALPVTDNGGSLTVDGSVAVTNFPATQPVSGTVAVSNFPASQTVDDGGGSLTVDGTVAISGSVAVTGPLTDTQLRATPVPVGDGGGSLTVDGTFFQATQPVSVAAVVHVDDNGGSLTVDGTVAISGSVAVTGPLTDAQLRAVAVPVSAATLPLPTGAATETTLASIDAGIPASLGQKTMANSMPVVVSSDQSALPVTGTFFQVTQPVSIAAAVPVTDNGGSLTVDGAVTVSGTVAVSNFPATQPISAVALPLPSGAATEATLASIDAGIPVTLGQTVMAGSMPVVIASDQSAVPISSTQLPAALVGGRLDVNIGSGSASGTQYTELDVYTSVTGTAVVWKDDASIIRAASPNQPLPVELKKSSMEELLYMILLEQRETRRVLCEGLLVNYEPVTEQT